MRVAYLGSDCALALELTRWFVDHAADAAQPSFDMTLEASGDAVADLATARACEGLWNATPHTACLHVAGHGKSALYKADLVIIDGRDPDERAARTERLALQSPFLCPDAVCAIYDGAALLDTVLAEALQLGRTTG